MGAGRGKAPALFCSRNWLGFVLKKVMAAAWFASVAGVAVALAATRGEAQARMAGAQDAAALRGDARRGGDAA